MEELDYIPEALLERVNEKLPYILENMVFDEKHEQIFKYRYGIESHMLTPKEISKTLKISMKKLKPQIIKIDNKVFNILKTESL